MTFNLPYKFQMSGREVVVQHSHNGHIRVSPNNMSVADGAGGQGQYARWRIHLEGGHHCRLQSIKTGQYLRIWRGGKETDVGGGTGPFTKFKIHYHSRPNGVKLESDRFPGRYIAVNPNRTMKIGGGGHHCNLWIKREGGPQHVVQHRQPQPKVIRVPQPVKVVQGGNNFGLPYQFKQNNLVVIRSNYGKHLRVNPNNNYAADGNGGTGKYAQWRVMLDGMGIVKLQNTHSGKYLRIQQNNEVNVGGTGGGLTRFRYHVHSHPNGVKLESVRFPGKYVAIRPNGAVMHGGGGVHTKLFFMRQGGNVRVVQQPVPVQKPVVIVQQPAQPQVIVASPNLAAQQQAQQQQAAIAAQQQQMQQQMEAMRIQNEAAMNAEKQKLELERQQLQAQQAALAQQQEAVLSSQKVLLEQQQQQLSNSNLHSPQAQQAAMSPQSTSPGATNEGMVAPVNPYYGGSGSNIVQQPPVQQVYPVLNQPVVQQQADIPNDESKAPEVVPRKGQDAANEVLAWLTKLKLERYYQTFIENGYDQLSTVGDISRDDLKEMGVALGHIKIIVLASLTAPFMNKKLRLKNCRYDTYVQNYGAPKDMKPGKRCILQHNDKRNNQGAEWIFEVIEDAATSGAFRLKHAISGSYLRALAKDGDVDSRSPVQKNCDMILEKHESTKGVYFIKERTNDMYIKCEEPRVMGRNKLACVEKKDAECKFNLLVIK